jgi:DNA-binding NarL/FixJ family response regulator
MTSVVIVDDQALVREGLAAMLARRGVEVLGTAGDGREAVAAAHRHDPDVVLMDIRMPVMDGIQATAALAGAERPRVLVLTTYHQDEYVYAALRAGAAGFLLKTTQPDRLVTAIEAVRAGESLLAPDITRRLIAEHLAARTDLSSGTADPPVNADARAMTALERLTPREREVLASWRRPGRTTRSPPSWSCRWPPS